MADVPQDHPGFIVAQNIAAAFIDLIVQVGGTNYVELQFADTENPSNPSVAVRLQKVGAVTPAERAKQLVISNQAVKHKLLDLCADLSRPDYDVDGEGVRDRLANIIQLIEDK